LPLPKGFSTADLLTEKARAKWRNGSGTWQAHNPHPPILVDDGRNNPHDTIGVLGIDASGTIGARVFDVGPGVQTSPPVATRR